MGQACHCRQQLSLRQLGQVAGVVVAVQQPQEAGSRLQAGPFECCRQVATLLQDRQRKQCLRQWSSGENGGDAKGCIGWEVCYCSMNLAGWWRQLQVYQVAAVVCMNRDELPQHARLCAEHLAVQRQAGAADCSKAVGQRFNAVWQIEALRSGLVK